MEQMVYAALASVATTLILINGLSGSAAWVAIKDFEKAKGKYEAVSAVKEYLERIRATKGTDRLFYGVFSRGVTVACKHYVKGY